MSNEKLGLALSGGGFRATAFHLGVLKCLHDNNVLEKVEVVSCVSGGAIIGAFWVWWQTFGAKEWDGFERALVKVMRADLRNRILLKTMGLVVVAVLLLRFLLWHFKLFPITYGLLDPLFTLIVAMAFGFLCWVLKSGSLLVKYYDHFLFNKKLLSETPATPDLLVNACFLESGAPIVFSQNDDWPSSPVSTAAKVAASVIPSVLLTNEPLRSLAKGLATALVDVAEVLVPVSLGTQKPQRNSNTTFAMAVAASSSVPGVFPPVEVQPGGPSGFKGMLHRTFRKEGSVAVDGGVFDNQGIHCLVELCDRIFISDAGALRWTPSVGQKIVHS